MSIGKSHSMAVAVLLAVVGASAPAVVARAAGAACSAQIQVQVGTRQETRHRAEEKARTETYQEQVGTRQETRYRTETYQVPVTGYRTESYTVQVPHQVSYSYQVPHTGHYTVSVPHTVSYSYSVPSTSCYGWGRWRYCYTSYRTYTGNYTYYTTETRSYTYYTTQYVNYTYYTTETRTRQVAYTYYETRTRQVPYTVEVPVYETRTRTVSYTEMVPHTVDVPVYETRTVDCTAALADLKRQYETAKKAGDQAAMDAAHQQADQLRVQGASEAQANLMVYGTPGGYFDIRQADQTAGTSQVPGENALAGTSYYSTTGMGVAWAGGDDIVVFDQKGDKVWEGKGDRRPDGRLIPPAEVRDMLNGRGLDFGVAPTYGRGNPAFFGTGGGIAAGDLGGQSFQARSPFGDHAPDYAGMQPVTMVLADGQPVEGYANVYHDANGLGYSAVPSTSGLGMKLIEAGFKSDEATGQVLLHNGAEGMFVGWDRATGPTGPSLVNLGTTCRWCTGGRITIGPGGNTGTGGAPGNNAPADNGNGGKGENGLPRIEGVSVTPGTVRFGEWLDVVVLTAGGVDRVTMRVNHRRTDLPADRFDYTLTRQGGASPGGQSWSTRIRVDWITTEEYQYAMRQQDGSPQWLDLCQCSIPSYKISAFASGPGGSTTGQADVIVQGTTIWVVPVPAGR